MKALKCIIFGSPHVQYISVKVNTALNLAPISNTYLLSTLVLPVIDIVVYSVLLDYPDLNDTCTDQYKIRSKVIAWKEVNRMNLKERQILPVGVATKVYAKREWNLMTQVLDFRAV